MEKGEKLHYSYNNPLLGVYRSSTLREMFDLEGSEPEFHSTGGMKTRGGSVVASSKRDKSVRRKPDNQAKAKGNPHNANKGEKVPQLPGGRSWFQAPYLDESDQFWRCMEQFGVVGKGPGHLLLGCPKAPAGEEEIVKPDYIYRFVVERCDFPFSCSAWKAHTPPPHAFKVWTIVPRDKGWIEVMFSRWCRDTHTSITTEGEIGSTLEDVAYLMQLSVNGQIDPSLDLTSDQDKIVEALKALQGLACGDPCLILFFVEVLDYVDRLCGQATKESKGVVRKRAKGEKLTSAKRQKVQCADDEVHSSSDGTFRAEGLLHAPRHGIGKSIENMTPIMEEIEGDGRHGSWSWESNNDDIEESEDEEEEEEGGEGDMQVDAEVEEEWQNAHS
ncbi:hypothetical protein RHGRI_014796 [Rhododendron griersonianum]|uniref:Uncharacterized protein n=1 Tax=Rhododendron griersonianum TaxID=479676 RepID=A0AAV6KB87_9ERIC|nr:hypothetical protein RHGRI_014796 [Rhododendron griersonianum]